MISERDDGENHNVFIEFCFEFCYLQPLTKMAMSHCKIDRITTAKDPEEGGMRIRKGWTGVKKSPWDSLQGRSLPLVG